MVGPPKVVETGENFSPFSPLDGPAITPFEVPFIGQRTAGND